MIYDVSDLLFDSGGCCDHTKILKGLARKCPQCGIIAHYDVHTKKETEIECFECGHKFMVKKYRRGERPGAINI